MSRAKRDFFDTAAFVRDFVVTLQNLQPNGDSKSLSEKLRQLNDFQWRSEIMDSENPSFSINLLHSILVSILECSPPEIRLSMLVELIAVSPIDLWEIMPPLLPPSKEILESLQCTPRKALLAFCKKQNNTVYLRALSNLLLRIPFEMWASDVVEYRDFAKKLFLSVDANHPDELSFFDAVLSKNSFVDLRKQHLPEDDVCNLMQMTEAEINQAQLGIFSNIPKEKWDQVLADRNRPSEYLGLTLLYAIILVLMKKISNSHLLEQALMKLVECVPPNAWDEPATGKKVSMGAKSSSAVAHSPRRLIWNLCQHGNGYFFFAVLFPILNHLPSERWQVEIPDYLKLVLTLFLKQGAELDFTVAAFFSLLVSHSPVKKSKWFEKFNLNGDTKQKRKGSAPIVVLSPVCILIDTLNAILKKFPVLATSLGEPMNFNAAIHTPGDGAAAAACSGAGVSSTINSSKMETAKTCSVLTKSLDIIAKRSAVDDWEPGITENGVIDVNGPLNHLVQLLLDDSQNPYFCKIVNTVLKKATQESVNYISRENREKILAMPQFAKNEKLLNASREKKPAPKKTVIKVVAKPAAKKAVVSVQAKPTENPVPKGAMSVSPCLFAAPAPSQSKEQSKVDSDDECFRRVFDSRPPRPLSPGESWFSEDDDLSGAVQNDVGHRSCPSS